MGAVSDSSDSGSGTLLSSPIVGGVWPIGSMPPSTFRTLLNIPADSCAVVFAGSFCTVAPRVIGGP